MDLVIYKPYGRGPLVACLLVYCPYHFSSSALAMVESALESMEEGERKDLRLKKRMKLPCKKLLLVDNTQDTTVGRE
jgi:hypothetical protein